MENVFAGVGGKQWWQGQEKAISPASLRASPQQGDVAVVFPTPAWTREPWGHILPREGNPSPAGGTCQGSVCPCVCQLRLCRKCWAEARSDSHLLPPSLHFEALLFPAPLLSRGVSSALLFTALYLFVWPRPSRTPQLLIDMYVFL